MHNSGGWVHGCLHNARVWGHPPPENLQFTALARQPQANPSNRPNPNQSRETARFGGVGGWNSAQCQGLPAPAPRKPAIYGPCQATPSKPKHSPKPEPKPGNCTFWGGGWLEFCTVPRFTCTRPPKTCNLRPILRQPQASAQTRTKAKKLHNLAWPRRSAIYGLSRLLFSAGEGELVSRSGVWF